MIKTAGNVLKGVFTRTAPLPVPERLFLPELPHLTMEEFCGIIYHSDWYNNLDVEQHAKIATELSMRTSGDKGKLFAPETYKHWIGCLFSASGMRPHEYADFIENMQTAIRELDLSLTLQEKEFGARMLFVYQTKNEPRNVAQPSVCADDGDWSHIIPPHR